MEYFAVGGVIAILLLQLVANFHQIAQFLAKRRARRRFQEFEDVISEPIVDPHRSRKFFAEEVVLEEDVSIFFPVFLENNELVDKYQVPLVAALNKAGLVDDTRAYTFVESCGIDLRLNNFVAGLELLRSMLIQLEAPRGTLIEYSGGDLPIYEDCPVTT